MSGKWMAFIPARKDKRDSPVVYEMGTERDYGHPTRASALAALRADLERQHKAAQEKVAELGRALANLLELEAEEP